MMPGGSVHVGADDAALIATLDALGMNSTAQQRWQLTKYVDVLMQWNAVHNLTAVRQRADVFTHHLADCLAVIPPLHRQLSTMPLEGRRAKVLDVGSGGGLPGLVMATLLPGIDVTCLDAVGKKIAFVRQAVLELQLANATAVHARVESFQDGLYDVVASRAFSSLDRFVALSAHALHPTGFWMAMKGRHPEDELAALQAAGMATFHVEQLSVPGLSAERCLIWMRPR